MAVGSLLVLVAKVGRELDYLGEAILCSESCNLCDECRGECGLARKQRIVFKYGIEGMRNQCVIIRLISHLFPLLPHLELNGRRNPICRR